MGRFTKHSRSRYRQSQLMRSSPILIVAWALAMLVAVHTANAREISFNIESQPIEGALLQLAETAEVQILFSPRAMDDSPFAGLQGEYSVRDALAATLAGTDLTFEFKSDDFVVVKDESRHEERAGHRGEVRRLASQERTNGVELARLQETAEEEDKEDGSADAEEDEEPLELEAQVVTGSRLSRGDPSARVHSFSAEQIAARGVSNLEELFRTLPWTYSQITTQTTSQHGTNFITRLNDEVDMGASELGLSTINLRNLGSQNTLVLINGRRIAGTAGREERFANLLNVPLSSVERVEIRLDGGSAVYGADAIGGLVNFITKKDYQGYSATFREEFSSTDSGRRSIDLRGGYAWGSGSVTASLSRNRSRPIDNRKIWTSNDFRDEFGPEYDLRVWRIGQPGIVCNFSEGNAWNYIFPYCAGRGTSPADLRFRLPDGHSGVGATPEDFKNIEDNWPWLRDYVHPQNGEDSTHDSANLRIEQYFGDEFRVYGELLFSKLHSYRQFPTLMLDYIIPASNAYNPFGKTVLVHYLPLKEIESGLIPPSYTESENKHYNLTAGFFWQFGRGHELEFNANRSESKRWFWQIRPDFRRSFHNPTVENFYRIIDSSDPNVAINVFGDGTVQGSGFVDLFTAPLGLARGKSTVTSIEPSLRGELFRLWGGRLSYAVGVEFREDVFYESEWFYRNKEWARVRTNDYFSGVERPTEDSRAFFGEFALPLVGPENSRPGLRSLVLSLQARADTYEALGAVGGRQLGTGQTVSHYYVPGEGWKERTVRNWYEHEGEVELQEKKLTATSERVGLLYKPLDSLKVRAAWSTSFRPPYFSKRFDVFGIRHSATYLRDPFHPDTPDEFVRVPLIDYNANPDLNPEEGDTWSVNFEWSPEFVPGLIWSADWSRVDYKNRVAHSSTYIYSYPEIGFQRPEIIERDENGYPVLAHYRDVNVSKKVSETVETMLEYTFDTRLGLFAPRLNYTRVLNEYFQFAPGLRRISSLGQFNASDRYKYKGSLTWLWGRIQADLFVHYTPSYISFAHGECLRVVGNCRHRFRTLPDLKAASLTTVDLTMSYRFDNGLHIRAGGRNILDTRPHVLWWEKPYDPVRWDARGRVLFLELNWER